MKQNRSARFELRLTAEESAALQSNFEKSGTASMSAYVRKKLFSGIIIHIDTTAIRELTSLMKRISNNINQIARRVNLNGNVYQEDLNEILKRQSELWEQLNQFITLFGRIGIGF